MLPSADTESESAVIQAVTAYPATRPVSQAQAADDHAGPDAWFAPGVADPDAAHPARPEPPAGAQPADTPVTAPVTAGMTFEEALAEAEEAIDRVRDGKIGVDDVPAETARIRQMLDECEQRLTAAERASAAPENQAGR